MFLSKISAPKILLTLICILFIFTRLYKINEIPLSVYWDEASIGYNAYSISQTGKDEWGKFLPIHFRAFGEFKLPVYIYSVVPFVKIFGLNEFSVRFPAVLFSLGVVILTLFLARKLTGSGSAALWSSFFVTISPWFFIFSRVGYEVGAGLAFYLLGVYLFLRLSDNRWFLLFSIMSFILSVYSYNSFRIISPLTILILIFFQKNNLKQLMMRQTIYLLIPFIFLTLSIIPIYKLYKYDVGNFRLQAVGIKSGSEFFSNYLSHFNPNFLFINGDKNLRSQQAGFGQLYLPDLALIILGITYIIVSKSKYGLLTIILFLIGPIPAALTKESPHALRSLSVVPFYSILSVYGVAYIRKRIKIKYLELIFAIIFLGFFIRYFINFLTIYPIQSSKEWQYPYKEIYTKYKDQFEKYDHIIITDEYAQPYIFALFYLKYDPEKFQAEVVRNSVDKWGFSTVRKFDKFEFGKVDKLTKKSLGKSLIFDLAEEKIYEQENY